MVSVNSNRILLFFFSAVSVFLTASISPAVAGEQPRLDSDYVNWCMEQLSPEMRLEIGALQYVLHPDQFRELLSLERDHMRRRWIDDYWSLRDPVYTTDENEALAEHKRRVAVAQDYFYMAKWPMWDQRGEVYIRYGDPVVRRTFPAQAPPPRYVRAGEVWFYPEHDMYVLFEDAFGSGEFTYFIERIRGPNRMSEERIHAIDKLMGAVRPMPSAWAIKQGEDNQKAVLRFYEVLEEVPSSYWYDFETNQQPFAFTVDGFRGGEWIDRVDVNIEFVADLSPGRFHADTKEFVATAVFWDPEGKEVGRRTQSLELPTVKQAADVADVTDAAGAAGASDVADDASAVDANDVADAGAAVAVTRVIPAQLVFSLGPGFYHMAVTVEDCTSGKVSSYRQDVTCFDFESKLAISDILFASKIAPAERPSPFNRGALEVVPHPIRKYSKSKSIPVYFEVYNLSVGDENLASYTVEYEVVSQSKKESSVWDLFRGDAPVIDISSSFQTTAHGSQDVVHILLNPESLREGEFALRIRIQDDVSGAEVDREVVFNIEK